MIFAAALLLANSPVHEQGNSEEGAAAVQQAIGACEHWLLDPGSWMSGVDKFGQAERLEPQQHVPDVALPPPPMRAALHHWRLPIGQGGIYLTTSDRIPFCHLAGGGPDDMQPAIVAATQAPQFEGRWRQTMARAEDGLATKQFVSTLDGAMTMTLSYAASPHQRTDRVQLLITIQYQTGN